MQTHTLTRPLPIRHKNEPCCEPVKEPAFSLAETAAMAGRLKAVADPTRLRMLDLLAQQDVPMCVCDLTDQFAQNQPTISHHLKLLRGAGLIGSEKQGIWAYYWATAEGRRVLAAIHTLV